MLGINKELDDKIKSECLIKKALHEARENMKLKRPVTRGKIEDIKAAHELKQLEKLQQDYIEE